MDADKAPPEPPVIVDQTVHETTTEQPGMEPITTTETVTHISTPPPPMEPPGWMERMDRLDTCLARIEARLTPPEPAPVVEEEAVVVVEEPEPMKPNRRRFKRTSR